MAQYSYQLYNVGQYPEQVGEIDKMAADGWTVHTALLNYTEIYILWERDAPVTAPEPTPRGTQPAPKGDPEPVQPTARKGSPDSETVRREGSFSVEEEVKTSGG